MKKIDKRLYAGIGITLAFALVFAFSFGASAEFSIMDRLLQIAGQTWGNKLPVPDMGDITLGAFPGGDIYNDVAIHGTFSQGGEVLATSTSLEATATLTEGDMLKYSIITYTGGVLSPALTLTLPATSTMTSLLKYPGDRRMWEIENDFTGAATTTTIAAGTGIDLQEPGTGNILDVVINIAGKAYLDCFRGADTDVVCLVTESSVAD